MLELFHSFQMRLGFFVQRLDQRKIFRQAIFSAFPIQVHVVLLFFTMVPPIKFLKDILLNNIPREPIRIFPESTFQILFFLGPLFSMILFFARSLFFVLSVIQPNIIKWPVEALRFYGHGPFQLIFSLQKWKSSANFVVIILPCTLFLL